MDRTPGQRFLLLVMVAIASMLLGILAGRFMRSPAQKALDTAPPPQSRITAPVEEMAAKGTVAARATLVTGQRVAVGPVTSSSALAVITGSAPAVGTTVSAGQQVLEVSGRPVVALPGAFPAYRDLKNGDKGPDVKQLNQALARLRLPAGTGSEFTAATSEGLGQLYRATGHEAPSGMDRREILFVPSLPATVISTSAPMGSTAAKPNLVVLTSGASRATAEVPTDAARSIVKGAHATLDLDSGTPVPALVESVEAAAGQTATVHLRPSAAFPEGSDGKDVRVSIEQRLAGKGALAVPLSAVYSGADGRTVVLVQQGQTETAVEVTPGATADGMVEVTPSAGGPGLKVGDAVVVNGP